MAKKRIKSQKRKTNEGRKTEEEREEREREKEKKLLLSKIHENQTIGFRWCKRQS